MNKKIFQKIVIFIFLTVALNACNSGNTDEASLSASVKDVNITQNQTISSPLPITGSAKGSFFFEGQFPISLQDKDGNTLSTCFAMAKSDWMTENYVPFTCTLSFENLTKKAGKLILKKDNPSGLKENDETVEIPVSIE
ncbi:MAG: Gmad2 immunoglobulin-like domain-containing protein [Candidatus Gracilibacteria bacterium]|jgi:hypothetical protein